MKDDRVVSSQKINPSSVLEGIPQGLNVSASFRSLSKIRSKKTSISMHKTCHLPKCCLFILDKDSGIVTLMHSKALMPFLQSCLLKTFWFRSNQCLHRLTNHLEVTSLLLNLPKNAPFAESTQEFIYPLAS